jgi:hypothetical protein
VWVVRRALQGTSLPIAFALLLTGCGTDVSTSNKSSTSYQSIAAGSSPDLETLAVWDQRYEADSSAIRIRDSGRNQANVSAPYQNNLQNCLDGLTYSCDRRLLSEADAIQVAVSDYQRNVRNCLDGLTYSCDRRLLSGSDAQQVAASDYRRNLRNCLDGLTYSCNRHMLSEVDVGQVVASDYQRNLQNCLQGLTYSCDQSYLSLEDQKLVDITLLRKQTVSPPSAWPGCAENGSCYGDISELTGRPKTVSVRGYYRRDGTYVRGHYRSTPSQVIKISQSSSISRIRYSPVP